MCLRKDEDKSQLVLPIPWDERRRQTFRDSFTAAVAGGMEVNGYQWTAGQLLRDEDVKRAADAGGSSRGLWRRIRREKPWSRR
jgi:hypothetical protein